MKIYIIKHNESGWDIFLSHVVIANTEIEVRDLAKKCDKERPSGVWNNAEITEVCTYTGTETTPFVLHSSFRNG